MHNTSSLATESPLEKLIAFTVPSAGAGSAFSIFMASRITTVSPLLTESPTCFKYRTIMPGMGAFKEAPSTAAAAGAGAAGLGGAGAGLGGSAGLGGAGAAAARGGTGIAAGGGAETGTPDGNC